MNYDEKTRKRIVKSVVAAAQGDPNKLTAQAYRWLNRAGGFIAHYDLHGFCTHYHLNSLTDDLRESAESCYSTYVNTAPNERYHEARAWGAVTMVEILKTLDIRPHGKEAVVTFRYPESEAIHLLLKD